MSIKVLSFVVAYILSIAAAIKAVDSETVSGKSQDEEVQKVIVDSSGETSLDTVADNLQEAYVEKVALIKDISLLEAKLSHAAHLAEANKHEAHLAVLDTMTETVQDEGGQEESDAGMQQAKKCFQVVNYACTNGYNGTTAQERVSAKKCYENSN